MRAIYMSAVVIAAMSWNSGTLAQEVVPTPVPEEATNSGPALAAPEERAPAAQRDSADANRWRYVWHEGHWWYWTPQERWKWCDNYGHWVDYDANRAAMPVASYAGVYHPGVAVGVGPAGNVSVGVGQRIGVDVWGAHGAVRVGPIAIGW